MSSLALLLALSPLASPPPRTPEPTTALVRSVDWEEAVRKGRALIAAGRGEEARSLLEHADKEDNGEMRTRLWYVRSLISINYLNDALDLIDDLQAAGHHGHEIDYLYGMAFVAKARKYVAQGVNLSMVGMQFSESVDLLLKATRANPTDYADAYLPLAEAAWNSQRLTVARTAAEVAVTKYPKSAAALYMRGEIAFSQYVVANADENAKDEAAKHWQVTFDSYQASAKIDARPGGEGWRLASALKKSGDALLWQARQEAASEQYALAMGHSPGSVDYGQLYTSLGPELFVAALTAGSEAFEREKGPTDPGDAGLLWWLGYAQFAKADYEASRQAFERAYAKWPESANSKWYIALCNVHLERIDDAIDAMLDLQASDPVTLNDSIGSNPEAYLAIIDRLVGHCFGANRLEDAGRLSAAQGNAAPDTGRYWNNVGLFYRDAGDNLPKTDGVTIDPALQKRYFEKSLEGYKRALALKPQDPVLLNDTAVVLHYFLKRDFKLARQMYLESTARAKIELAGTKLAEKERTLVETALDDSQKNLRHVEQLIKQLADEAAAKTAREKDQESGG